jgi:hypothetical protein
MKRIIGETITKWFRRTGMSKIKDAWHMNDRGTVDHVIKY